MPSILQPLYTSDTTSRCMQEGIGSCTYLEDSESKDKPVAYESKSLTQAETRYVNIEQEMLAVVFGCMRFHHYI